MLQRCVFQGIAFVCLGVTPAALYGQARVLTWHNDNARTGQNLQERILTPQNVRASGFGKLFVIGDKGGPQGALDGKVDAQPLYVPSVAIPGQGVHNVLYVMTEHGTAYAFDADNGAMLWKVSTLGANESPSDIRMSAVQFRPWPPHFQQLTDPPKRSFIPIHSKSLVRRG